MRQMLIIILLVGFCSQILAQKLDYEKEYTIGDKSFVTSKKGSESALAIENKSNLNRKSGYDALSLMDARFDRQKFADLVLQVFPEDRINKLKKTASYGVPAFWITLHFDRSGKISAIAYLVRENTSIELVELSLLEDLIKKEIVLKNLEWSDLKGYDRFMATFHVSLSKILDGRFVK